MAEMKLGFGIWCFNRWYLVIEKGGLHEKE